MQNTIFFSWQSDRPAKEGRSFLEQALKDAVARIARDVTVEDAVRDGLEVDKDTKGVPGSPSIIETIFRKIDRAAVFVPDLTFVGARGTGGLTPNPNVLIEYGWALKSLTRSRIAAVMNVAHGAPHGALPFDLAHMRFPITYNLQTSTSAEERRSEQKRLSAAFEDAIRLVLTSPEHLATRSPEPKPEVFPEKQPVDSGGRFRKSDDAIGITWRELPAQTIPSLEVRLPDGPAMWLRLLPSVDPKRIWSATELRDTARHSGKHLLIPFVRDGIEYLRAEDGFGVFSKEGTFNSIVRSWSLAFAFETGEIWSVDTFHFGVGQDKLYLESIVKLYVASSADYDEYLQLLGIEQPYRWIAGLSGIKNRRLAIVPPSGFSSVYEGPECLSDPIVGTGTYEPDQSPREALRPFFDLICRKCGRTFPEYPPYV